MHARSGRNVRIRTYGCQMNEYESEVIAGLLEAEGWTVTDDECRADVILFNTCCVRQHAEDRVWGALFDLCQKAAREPDLVIGVCGCMAQARSDEIARRCPHVRVICGTRAFDRLPELLARTAGRRGRIIDVDMSRVPCLAGLPRKRAHRLTAFVAVMRGCGNYCAYCIVPSVRGAEVGRPPGEILREVEALARDGCREVTLLGQNVNSYTAPGVSFAELLRLVGSVRGVERIRFMTSHPKDFPDELIRAMAGVPQVCEHLHLPLQSGSDRVLAAMRRGYTVANYNEIVTKAREAIPSLALSTDILAGFPGEKEEDHAQTARAMEEITFDAAFIFKYSDREGTKAAAMKPKVAQDEIARRHAELLKLQESISLARNRRLIGRPVEVLVEGYSPRKPGRLFGRTRTNKRVAFEGGVDLIGRCVCVTIREVTPLTLIGDSCPVVRDV